jgi:hypothetical protein
VSGRRGPLEYSGSTSAAALASLAKWSGLSLREVTEYARHNAISELIAEVRSTGGARRGITPLVAYQTLRNKEVLYQAMLRSFGEA